MVDISYVIVLPALINKIIVNDLAVQRAFAKTQITDDITRS